MIHNKEFCVLLIFCLCLSHQHLHPVVGKVWQSDQEKHLSAIGDCHPVLWHEILNQDFSSKKKKNDHGLFWNTRKKH